ncbi:glucose uptake inhibitor SgrT [Dickeya undicola]|uniref:glucose uptake inhibitor SgrT n=1 Tax=Dickeya undicola TaxID=1577887 RepID=UPI001F468966|nr:glucose uptake inhibitor SgrT [Dickeya undicola]
MKGWTYAPVIPLLPSLALPGMSPGVGGLTAGQRMALLLQVTQWQIRDMDEEEYRRWL